MKRELIKTSRLFCFCLLTSGLFSSGALAATVVIGQQTSTTLPSCNEIIDNCYAIGKVTGFQSTGSGAYTAKKNGKIVDWSVTLGNPKSKDVKFFDGKFKTTDLPPKVQLSILRKAKKQDIYQLVAKSDEVDITNYYGSSPVIALKKPIPVKKGDVVGLTVTTWAPVLRVKLPLTYSWVADRVSNKCKDLTGGSVQKTISSRRAYQCTYKSAQLLYSAHMETS